MFGEETYIDKSMNGIKTITDGFTVIQNGNIETNNISTSQIESSHISSNTGEFDNFIIETLSVNDVNANEITATKFFTKGDEFTEGVEISDLAIKIRNPYRVETPLRVLINRDGYKLYDDFGILKASINISSSVNASEFVFIDASGQDVEALTYTKYLNLARLNSNNTFTGSNNTFTNSTSFNTFSSNSGTMGSTSSPFLATQNNHITTKQYVDNTITNLNVSTIPRTNTNNTFTSTNTFTTIQTDNISVGLTGSIGTTGSPFIATSNNHITTKKYVDDTILNYSTGLNPSTIARLNINNSFTGNQTISGNVDISGSFISRNGAAIIPPQFRVDGVITTFPNFNGNYFPYGDNNFTNLLCADTTVGGNLTSLYDVAAIRNMSCGATLFTNNISNNTTALTITSIPGLTINANTNITGSFSVQGKNLGNFRPLILGTWYNVDPFIHTYHITCSLKNLTGPVGPIADKDNYIFLERGVKFVSYNGINYSGYLYTLDNTNGTEPQFYKVSDYYNIDNTGSFKVFYYGTEITFGPFS